MGSIFGDSLYAFKYANEALKSKSAFDKTGTYEFSIVSVSCKVYNAKSIILINSFLYDSSCSGIAQFCNACFLLSKISLNVKLDIGCCDTDKSSLLALLNGNVIFIVFPSWSSGIYKSPYSLNKTASLLNFPLCNSLLIYRKYEGLAFGLSDVSEFITNSALLISDSLILFTGKFLYAIATGISTLSNNITASVLLIAFPISLSNSFIICS